MFQGLSPENHSQNLALTVFRVPHAFDGGPHAGFPLAKINRQTFFFINKLRMAHLLVGNDAPLLSQYGICKSVKARFRTCLSGKNPENAQVVPSSLGPVVSVHVYASETILE